MTGNPEDLKSSAHVWGDGLTDDPNHQPSRSRHPTSTPQLIDLPPPDEPPSYTNATLTPSEATPQPQPQRRTTPPRIRLNPIQSLSLFSSLPFHSYSIPSATITNNRSITESTYAPFFSSPASLTKLVTDQASIPPRPLLRFKGTHVDNNRYTVVDFDVIINLTALLDISPPPTSDIEAGPRAPPLRISFKELPIESESSRPASSGSRLFKREKPRPSDLSPLQKWTTKYVADKSENKSFTLTRTIPHFVPLQQAIEGSLRTLLHTLQYRGKVEVTFPTQHSSVVVSKKPTNWFVSMLNLHPEKKYDVVESPWQWRGHPSPPSANSSSATDPITLSERDFKAGIANARSLAEEFWGDWRDVVRNAVLRGHKGKVGVEEWIEAQMGRREKERGKEWGVDGTWDQSGVTGWKWGDDDDGL